MTIAGNKLDKLNDRWLRIIGIPLVSLLATLTFDCNVWLPTHSWYWFAVSFLSSIATAIPTWEACRVVLLVVRHRFPGIGNTGMRILFSYIFYLLTCIIITAVLFYFYRITNLWEYQIGWRDYLKNLITAFIFVAPLAFVYEGVYYFREWRRTIINTEELKKSGLQSQLDSLQNQISPHFLFNSLNVLQSLIEEDFDRADQYVQQLSRVYHYVLQSNEAQLTPLYAELEFIESYVFLLKTRFGDNLNVQLNVPDKFHQYFIPPLTLQMLLENAVKHNIVSSQKPLEIKIDFEEHNLLTVSNNLQKKMQYVPSAKVGLNNIRKRYEMNGITGMKVNESGHAFSVSIPLIKRETAIAKSLNEDVRLLKMEEA